MRNHALFITTCTAMLLCGCKKKETVENVAPVRVETATVGSSSIESGRTYAGVIEESKGTVLSFKIPGTILSIDVAEGQKVAKGQLVATLDDSSLRSNYEIAKAALATAQDTYDRMKKLHDANSIPEMKWVEVENSLQAAKSACEIALNALNDTKIYAPTAGIIAKKAADAGSTAIPAMPIVKLVDISPVKATISVPESEIGALDASTVASVYVEAAGGATFTGKLSDKGVAADPLSRSYTVKFTVNNPDGAMLPGMLCNVTVSSGEATETIVIPVESVLLDNSNHTFVWIVDNGKAYKRVVELGGYLPGGVAVESGLTDGDELITGGQQKVSDGMAVTSINK